MRDDRFKSAGEPGLPKISDLLRYLAVILGLVAIVIGLFYTTKLFDVIFTGLKNPEPFAVTLDQWSRYFGGNQLDVEFEGKVIPSARILSIIVIGGGLYLLVSLALGLIKVGAKVISLTVGDLQVVKRVLAQTIAEFRKTVNQPPD